MIGVVVGAGIVAAVSNGGFSFADPGVQLPAPAEHPAADEIAAQHPDDAKREPTDAPAASPQAAVSGFVAAAVDGRFADEYTRLSAQDRERFGSPAGWIAARADLLPPITGHTIERTVRVEPDRAEVHGRVGFVAGLDEVRGLTPPAANVRWVTVRDPDTGWHIDLGATTVTPVHSDDEEGAQAAARTWAEDRRRCAASDAEWDGGLVGHPALADALCGQQAPATASSVASFATVDAAAFGAAFGPDVTSWARVVELGAPANLRAVVAPVGRRWLVIGVLPAAS